MAKKKKAVCLLSGGLDSATAAYEARRQGYDVYCLTIDYGQRHKRELRSARTVARCVATQHRVVRVTLPWGGSALTDRGIAVPLDRKIARETKAIPATYVPSRNIIFLSLACSWAEVLGAQAVFIGANQLDYSGYPDCRDTFLRAFERTVRCGTKAGIERKTLKIKAPLIRLDKQGIIKRAVRLGVPIEKTWSCYQGGKKPCGRCDACLLRARGFKAAGIVPV